MKTDVGIRLAVIREFRWDTRVDETDIEIEVNDGIVTLTGTVDSYLHRMAAQEAARRVSGVLGVVNDLRVHIPGTEVRTTPEICQAVRRALEWHTGVPYQHIRSWVTDGRVTLEGPVAYWFEREDAEKAVQHLVGVKEIVNRIVVPPAVAPLTVRAEIEDALDRWVEQASKHIDVVVEHGTVTLRGTVRSWPEKRAVLEAVHFTRGVGEVIDELRIAPNLRQDERPSREGTSSGDAASGEPLLCPIVRSKVTA